MAKRVTWLWLVVVLIVSCQKTGERGFVEGRQAFRELLTLRDQISKEFHDRVSDVSITENRMTVKFVDSPLGSRTREEKQQRADAVARFVLKNYKQPLSSVSIQFISETAGSGASMSAGETYVGRAGAP